MTASNSDDRHRRARLADAIVRRRGEIERRWLELVSMSVRRPDLSPSELRDGMPLYLLRLAEGLSEEESAQTGGS